MSLHLRKRTHPRVQGRLKRKLRIRKKVNGNSERPRLNFFRGSKAFYVQFIDDLAGNTILGVSSATKKLKGQIKVNKEGAKKFAEYVYELAKEKGIKEVVFDRNGYKFHGVVKEFADTLRQKGIKF